MRKPVLREAVQDDLPVIADIYNHAIVHTTSVYSETEVDIAERENWLSAKRVHGFPVLVAEIDGIVLGFASFGDFRAWPGYRHTVEHSVYVDTKARRMGIASALVSGLLPIAAAMNKHVMIAGVDADNVASMKLHAKLGFKKVAHFEQVGWKFGRWLDLVFLQRYLDD